MTVILSQLKTRKNIRFKLMGKNGCSFKLLRSVLLRKNIWKSQNVMSTQPSCPSIPNSMDLMEFLSKHLKNVWSGLVGPLEVLGPDLPGIGIFENSKPKFGLN